MSITLLDTDSTTLVLNGYTFKSFIAGDFVELAPVNPLTARINSTDDSLTIVKRLDGNVYNLTIRIVKNSADDIFLNTTINNGLIVLNGSAVTNFIKDGINSVETWNLENGSITTLPTDTKNNVDGNAVMEVVIQFRNAVRAI